LPRAEALQLVAFELRAAAKLQAVHKKDGVTFGYAVIKSYFTL
jgi:hypothetical protein